MVNKLIMDQCVGFSELYWHINRKIFHYYIVVSVSSQKSDLVTLESTFLSKKGESHLP